ncbi:MAG TPA: RNA methyltransferase [Chloroflexota bacterium]|nr:RNA methyltransferase [Chloroflexota bacterium]
MPRHDDRSGAAQHGHAPRPTASSAAREDTPVNAAIRAARDLKSAQGRREQGRYLLEGVRLIEDALDQGLEPDFVFITPHLLESTPRGRTIATWLRQSGIPLFELNERLLRLISDTETPPGIIAVAHMPRPLATLPGPWASGLSAVLLDHVRDPGNVGGILRTAAAAGIELVVSTEGSVDLYAPKVVRAGAGAHLRLELAPARPIEELAPWLDRWPLRTLADAHARTTLYDVDWRQPSVLVVSNEAHGSDEWLRERGLQGVSVPMRAATESLNVAAATAVLIYEARRPFLHSQARSRPTARHQ